MVHLYRFACHCLHPGFVCDRVEFVYVSISVSASERATCVMLKEKMKTAVLSLLH